MFFRLLRCTRNKGQTVQTDWISSSLFLTPILWQLLPHTQPRPIAITITYVRYYSPPAKRLNLSRDINFVPVGSMRRFVDSFPPRSSTARAHRCWGWPDRPDLPVIPAFRQGWDYGWHHCDVASSLCSRTACISTADHLDNETVLTLPPMNN